MADEDLRNFPKGPPESEEEWQRLHRAVYRSDKTWVVTGPQVALVSNWKAWFFAISLLVLLRRTEVVAVLDMLAGAGK